MTPEDQQKHQDTHQQSRGGDDDGVVTMTCLHCIISKAIDDWIVDFKEKTGTAVCMNHVAQDIGAVLEDFLVNVRDTHGQVGVEIIGEAIRQGQMNQRAANAEAEAEPVQPDPNTKH